MIKTYLRFNFITLLLVSSGTIPAQNLVTNNAAQDVQITRINQDYFFTDSLEQKLLNIGFDTIWNNGKNSWSDDLNCFVAKEGHKTFLYTLDLRSRMTFDSVQLTNSDLFIGILDGSFSLVNDEMKILLKDYASIRSIRRHYGEFIVRIDGKEGVMDYDGEVIVPLTYERLYDYGSWDHLGVLQNGRAGILDLEKNKILVTPAHEIIFSSHIHEDGEKLRFLTINKGKFGLVNKRGRTLLPPTYDGITTWVEHGPDGHFVLLNNKVGLIDYNGRTLVSPIYDELATTSTNHLVKGVLAGKFGMLNAEFRPLIPFIYESIIVDDFYIREGKAPAIYAYKDGVWRKFDIEGKLITTNANNDPYILDLADFKINHYDLEYTRICLFSTKEVSLPDGSF